MVKVSFTPELAMKAQMGVDVELCSFVNLGAPCILDAMYAKYTKLTPYTLVEIDKSYGETWCH